MDKVVIYIHGKGGNAGEAVHYEPLFSDYDVVGLDYTAQSPCWSSSRKITITLPCWKRYCIPNFTFLLIDSDSCCASDAIMVSKTSPFASIVLMDSF